MLYGLVPNINWCIVCQLIAIFVSLCIISYVLCKKHGIHIGALISVPLLVYIGRFGLPRVEICIWLSAILPLIYYVELDNKTNVKQVIAYILALVMIQVPMLKTATVDPFEEERNFSRTIFEEYAEDKDHLYVCVVSIMSNIGVSR